MLRIRLLAIFVSFVVLTGSSTAQEDVPSKIASDERVVFFPQAARLTEDGKAWIVPVQGWIFEPEVSDLKRRALLRTLKADLKLAADQESVDRFEKRMSYFLVDNERGKKVGIRIGRFRFTMPQSSKAGHFRRELTIGKSIVEQQARNGWLTFDVPMPAESPRQFTGRALLRPPAGVTVISDIDDTVKVSQVRSRTMLIANTFLNEFQAVEGMPALYRDWQKKGADFTFVSACPWQLYPALKSWMEKEEFPPATFQLRQIRFRDTSLLKLFDDPFESKVARVSRLLKQFPRRRFILVGDSGEKDPEVYGALTRKFPDQIVISLIRNVTEESASSPRIKNAFRGIAPHRWKVFDRASEIDLPKAAFE